MIRFLISVPSRYTLKITRPMVEVSGKSEILDAYEVCINVDIRYNVTTTYESKLLYSTSTHKDEKKSTHSKKNAPSGRISSSLL